ncbi:probable cytochrome P450 304a1 [Plodia interpunctella]|uniref:probable cytochrome P450 304a1 n=1 Tax=Plodia interpunctella TaxID=58824 RepID=UPI002367572E|nr:probable cytochrome P450 304a1 [Plodia interpunctella]
MIQYTKYTKTKLLLYHAQFRSALVLYKMIGVIAGALLLMMLCRYLYKNAYKRPSDKFPPGPPSLPVYGAYWIVLWHGYNDLANAFMKLGEIYKTKMVGLYWGSAPALVINDPVLSKEMLCSDAFDGRTDIILNRLRSYWKKLGIFFTDSYFWYVQRRFSLRYFRDYGFGRRDEILETVLEAEIKIMLDLRLNGPQNAAEKEIVKGDLVLLPYYLSTPFTNGILHVLSRTTIPRSEYVVLWELSRKAFIFQRSSDDLGRALSLTPWLKDVAPSWSGYTNLREGVQHFLSFFENLIKQVLDTYDESHERHFLDAYIKKMNEDLRDNEKSTFSVDQLVLICVDYMFPAASTAASVLTLLLERLVIQPELQDGMQEEVDRVVGSGRLPNLDDRQNMPYTEACIRESMRFDTQIPFGVPHRATRDTVFNGYHIPKDTMVAVNYVMLNNDKAIWGDPETFRPERFIGGGKLDLSKDRSLPFGAGHRLCAGETFTRNTMFCTVAALMQRFRVERAPGSAAPPAPRLQGLITTVPDFWIKLTLRNNHY